MRRIIQILCLGLVFTIACSSFVKDETLPELNKYENNIYVTGENIEIGDLSLKKNTPVRIIIVPGDEWIKVYAYPAKKDVLKAKRTLVLYLFQDQFPDELFDVAWFEKKLYSRLKLKK